MINENSTELVEVTDFANVEIARIVKPGSPMDGVTGRVAAVIFAYPGWPCDLVFLTILDGNYAGRTIPIRADLCMAVEFESSNGSVNGCDPSYTSGEANRAGTCDCLPGN